MFILHLNFLDFPRGEADFKTLLKRAEAINEDPNSSFVYLFGNYMAKFRTNGVKSTFSPVMKWDPMDPDPERNSRWEAVRYYRFPTLEKYHPPFKVVRGFVENTLEILLGLKEELEQLRA